MATIQFENKVALIENADIPDINKVKADDMNEIKSVVNENSINVGVEEPTDETVWVEYSKNLFNSSIQQGNITSTGYDTTSTTRICTNSFIKVEPGGIYTLSFTGTDISYYDACYFTTNSFPRNSESGWVSNGSSFTVPNDCEYIQFSFRKTASSTITPSEISNIMLNPGSTASTYEPYTQSTININNNGVYEKLTDTLNVGTEENGKCRVNVLKSNNLFDSSKVISNYNITSSGTMEAGTGFNLYIVPIKPDTNYIMSIGSERLWVYGFYTGYPTTSSTTINGQRIVNTATNETFTTPSNANFMCIREIVGGGGGNEIITNLMLNKGNTLLPYKPYVVPSINVDSEMLVSKNVYSTGEVVIGEWLGKTLYRKVVQINYPSGSTTGSQSAGISNVDNITKVETLIHKQSSQNDYESNYYSSSSEYLRVFYRKNTGNLEIRSASTPNPYIIYVTLEYTKTTD